MELFWTRRLIDFNPSDRIQFAMAGDFHYKVPIELPCDSHKWFQWWNAWNWQWVRSTRTFGWSISLAYIIGQVQCIQVHSARDCRRYFTMRYQLSYPVSFAMRWAVEDLKWRQDFPSRTLWRVELFWRKRLIDSHPSQCIQLSLSYCGWYSFCAQILVGLIGCEQSVSLYLRQIFSTNSGATTAT